MISIRLIQRISSVILNVLFGVGTLVGFFMLYRTVFTDWGVPNTGFLIGKCIGFLIAGGLLIGISSYSLDLAYILSLICTSQIITSLVFAWRAMKFEFWSYYIIFIADIFFIIVLSSVIVIGSMMGIGLKVGLVFLLKENKSKFATKLALPEQLINQFFINNEEEK